MMKHKYLSIIAAAAAVLAAAACGKVAEEFDPNDPSVMTIAVTPETVNLNAVDGSATVSFKAPDYWFVSSPNDWLVFEPASGKPGDVTLNIKAVQNTGTTREAVVTITSKKQRGVFKISQDAWPYSADTWSVYGTVNGNKDFVMNDMGDKLVWQAQGLPYYIGETFKFRMGGSDATVVGLDGGLAMVDGDQVAYSASIKKGGDNVALSDHGFWDVTIDLNNWTMSAVLAERFPWTLVGSFNGTAGELELTDQGDRMVWSVERVPIVASDSFKLLMNGNEAFTMGIDGALKEAGENTYTGALKQGGGNISLPLEGYWNFTFDLNQNSMTAEFAAEFPKPDPNPLPSDWTPIWLNDGTHGAASWDGVYRYGLEGTDGNNECVATFPQAVWDKIKSETVYVYLSGENPQIRVTTGWWSANLTASDIQPGNELLTDNQAGTWILELNLAGSAIENAIDVEHLLFTGSGFTVEGLYVIKEDPLKNCLAVWQNADPDAIGPVSWSSQYRFGLDGTDGNNECVTTFSESIWNKIKTGTFYLLLKGDNPQIRVTTGWWSANLTSADIQPGNALLSEYGDAWLLEVNLVGSPIENNVDVEHLLFTGDRFTPMALYVPVEKVVFWENPGSDAVSWSSQYRFGMDGTDGNNECIATFPQDLWNRIKSEKFYMSLTGGDPQIRVTTGWWSVNLTAADIQPGNALLTDKGNGNWMLEISLAGTDVESHLDVEHLLFTGDRFTPKELYFLE